MDEMERETEEKKNSPPWLLHIDRGGGTFCKLATEL